MSDLPSHSAFIGTATLQHGSKAEVALAVKQALASDAAAQILVFENATGRQIDFDLRESDADVAARYAETELTEVTDAGGDTAAEPSPPTRGRPKLGVVAREVTLLPRHWEWLASRKGGASVAIRRLVDEARKASAAEDEAKAARDAAYAFMSAIAGDFQNFEEATRALFASDASRFLQLIQSWPHDIRNHIIRLARMGSV